ncbi:hypothetical protein BDB00DRAFT_866441 [Zychaea mexicana]|uniref:uncharacterized protein n=1 Tax=Zychaea mexicana TaxID=64656 RepID=UPI0022FE282D|nr:uncharacterized protein BDB00DRAFT_866441 [Zychaea mexicana]KAI9499575.1 hypothetical protein BDB00DRAFT_866441 [Zychaea mexicana]
MTATAGAGGLAVATYSNIKNRQPKVEEQPVDTTTFEDQQYYGNLAIGPSSPTHVIANNYDNNGVQVNDNNSNRSNMIHINSIHMLYSLMPQASAINPFLFRQMTIRSRLVLAGGGAYVPALVPTIHDQPRQSQEMIALRGGGGKRGSCIMAASIGNTAESKQQRPQHIQIKSGDYNNNRIRMLWDDGLASAGGSTVARSASTASIIRFRSSMYNPCDGVNSDLRI